MYFNLSQMLRSLSNLYKNRFCNGHSSSINLSSHSLNYYEYCWIYFTIEEKCGKSRTITRNTYTFVELISSSSIIIPIGQPPYLDDMTFC